MARSISPCFLFLFLILTLIHVSDLTADTQSNVTDLERDDRVGKYNHSLYADDRRVGARDKNKIGGSGGWSYSWGWGGGGGGGGGGGKNGSGWGWGWGGGGGGGGKGWWRWGCDGGTHKHGSHQRQDRKRVSGLQDEYRVGEYAKCVVKGKCHGLRLVCPLHCDGPCAYDCRNMCKAHCIR